MKLALLQKQSMPDIPNVLAKQGIIKKRQRSSLANDTRLLILQLVEGGLVAGHGSQKLLGWFSGPGLKGTAGWLESMGLTPGTPWATAASLSEFGGGVLTTLGFLSPLGSFGTMGSMIMATVKAHWGKPIWVTQGGAELPIMNMATALALALTGPGRFSLDRALGIRLPRPLVATIVTVEAATLVLGILSRPEAAPAAAAQEQAATPVSAGQ